MILSYTLSAGAIHCTAAVGIPLRTASVAITAACSSRTILLHTDSGRTAIANRRFL